MELVQIFRMGNGSVVTTILSKKTSEREIQNHGCESETTEFDAFSP